MVDYRSSHQEMLDHVVEALIKQGCRSMVGFYCAYRDGENKCAAGHLVTEEIPSNWNTESFAHLAKAMKLEVPEENIKFIGMLQDCHDHINPNIPWVETFLAKAKQLAAKYKLEWKFDDYVI